jgi:hypothetical protein
MTEPVDAAHERAGGALLDLDGIGGPLGFIVGE